MNKQIEEMAKIMCKECAKSLGPCEGYMCEASLQQAKALYEEGCRMQSEGEWEWFEEWSPSTTKYPKECYYCGWRCGKCRTALEEVVVGYWDDPEKKPNLNFCPECGAKMKGGES